MDRAMLWKHLAIVERHVANGLRQVQRQHEIADELERDGHAGASQEARRLLAQFEEIQALHVAHRARLLKELADNSN
jgi:hypothetical protein